MMRKILIGVAVVAAAALAYYFWRRRPTGAAAKTAGLGAAHLSSDTIIPPAPSLPVRGSRTIPEGSPVNGAGPVPEGTPGWSSGPPVYGVTELGNDVQRATAIGRRF